MRQVLRAACQTLRRTLPAAAVLVVAAYTLPASATTAPASYYTLTPCRVLDTRSTPPSLAGPQPNRREIVIVGACGVPTTASAVALNLTIVNATTAGTLVAYDADIPAAPNVSTLSFRANKTRANNAIVGLGSQSGPPVSIAVEVPDFATSDDTADLIVDVVGYFVPGQPPVLTAGGTLNYTENDPPTAIDTTITVTDPDSAELGSATVQVTANYVNGQDLLSFTNTATITGVFTAATGTLTLTGTDTLANWQAALRSVKYENASDSPSTAARTVSWIGSDTDGNSSAPVTSTINITAVNDPPDLTAGGTLNYTEGDPASAIDTTILADDVDSANLASATVQITGNYQNGEDILSFTDTPQITGVFTAATGTLALTGSDTLANWQTALRSVKYNNTSVSPSTSPRTVTWIASDGAASSSPVTSTINVTSTNSAPVLTAGGTLNYTENGAAAAIDTTITVTDADNANLASATVQITGSYQNGQDVLSFTNTPQITGVFSAASGTLTLTGSDTLASWQSALRSVAYNNTSEDPSTVTRTVTWIASDGTSSSAPVTSTISVTAVNDAPTLTAGGTLGYTENDPPTAIDTTITASDPDNANLASATVQISGNYQNGQDVLSFANTATITAIFTAATGTLALTGSDTVANWQTALRSVRYENTSDGPNTAARTVTWIASDGTASSSPVTSTVNVTSVNDAPTDIALSPTSVDEGQPVNTVVGSFSTTDLDPGDTFVYTLVGGAGSTDNASFNISGNQLRTSAVFNYAVQNSYSIRVQTQDQGGTGATFQKIFTISVNDVPEPPSAVDDSYETIGNTELRVDLAAGSTPNVAVTSPASPPNKGVLDNDVDGDSGQTDTLEVSAIVGCGDTTAPFGDGPACNTANGGTVLMQSDGSFSFLPKEGDTAATDSFSYTARDTTSMTDTALVTIHRVSRVWYVKNDQAAGGLGRSFDPFDTLAEAETASVAGDTIHVYAGDGTTTGQDAGIALKANQRLIGEGVQLDMPFSVNGGPNPTVLRPAGSQPLLDRTGGTGEDVRGQDVAGLEIRGLSLAGDANAIDLTTTGGNSGGAIIANNTIRDAGAEGIDVNAGGSGTMSLDIHDNTWNVAGTHTGNAVDIARTAGTMTLNFSNNTNILSANATGAAVSISGGTAASATVTGFANNTVHGDSAGSGIAISNVTFDATPGGTFQAVNGGTLTVGQLVNPVGRGGLLLTNVAGDLSFADLDIVNGGGTGLLATGASAYTGSAGLRLSVASGVASINSNGGPAVDLNTVSGSLPFQTVASSSSPTSGVSLVNFADGSGNALFSAGSGGDILTAPGAAGPSFNVSGGNAQITYGGDITYPSGAGRVVSIDGWTGDDSTDDLLLSGAITSGDATGATTDGGGILVSNNAGAGRTITLGGNITIFTSGITATDEPFVATSNTNSGGLSAPGSNIVNSVSATAIRVANTTIGSSNIVFRRVDCGNNTAAADPVNGIVVNNTGSIGRLVVSNNNGFANGAGTIQHTSGDGVSLTNTFGPEFTNLTVTDTGGDGVGGTQVTSFTFVNGQISNSGSVALTNSSNIGFNDVAATTERNLSGTVTITGNTLTNAAFHGVDIFNFNGSISNANISNNTFTSTTSTATSKGSAIRLIASDSASTQADVTKATIDSNVITGFPSGSGIVAQGQSLSAGGVTFGTFGSATNRIDITNNRIAGTSAASRMAINAIQTVVNGNGQGSFNISNNGTPANPITNVTGNKIVNSAIGNVSVTTLLNANRIVDTTGVGGSVGISLGADSVLPSCSIGSGTCGAPNYHVTATNNVISGTDGAGILARSVNNTGSMNIAVQSNSVGAPLSGFREGIQVHSGSATGNTSVCMLMTGNTSAGSGGADGIGLRKQGTAPATQAFSVDGMVVTSSPAVETYVFALNPASADGTDADALGVDLISATSGFTNCSFVP